MSRINVFFESSDNPITGERERYLRGYFYSEKATLFEGERSWDGNNMACVHLKDGTRGENLYRTAQGRWVVEYWSRWEGEETRYTYITDDEARAWLLVNDDEDAVEKYFGEMPEEEGPKLGGRPAIGPKVDFALEQNSIDRVKAYAAQNSTAVAEAYRIIIAAGCDALGV